MHHKHNPCAARLAATPALLLLLLLLLLLNVQVGTPRTHRRYLSREDGTYGPIPSRRPLGMLSMPFNSTSVEVRS
jgi:phytoene dehydrogenase-like protein